MPPKRTGANRKKKRGPATRTHEHLHSYRILTLTTKSRPMKEEIYPFALKDLIDERVLGTETDWRMIGYDAEFHIASGNQIDTVSVNLGHSGPWVRRGLGADDFNQQFVARPFPSNRKLRFQKRLLARSERQYVSPHKDDTNTIDLKIIDVCGVIPGATIKITFHAHILRAHLPTLVDGAHDPAIDLYEDQDVSSGGAQPGPSTGVNDIPKQIRVSSGVYTNKSQSSPYSYESSTLSHGFHITVTGTVNIVGEFYASFPTDPSTLQREYAEAGYKGSIAYRQ